MLFALFVFSNMYCVMTIGLIVGRVTGVDVEQHGAFNCSQGKGGMDADCCGIYGYIWMFPKIGVPPSHPS